MNHSPLPWKVQRGIRTSDFNYAQIIDINNQYVAINLVETQAELIVHSVNTYPQAIKTIKKAIELIDNHEGLQAYQLLAQFLKENQ